jgi:hypothetical protein
MCDHENREEAMVVLERNAEGKPTVWCDPCIAPLVKALNDAGLRTVASCCGHGKVAGSVILADHRWIHIQQGTVVNGRWTFDVPIVLIHQEHADV